jgi:hypothetical protein
MADKMATMSESLELSIVFEFAPGGIGGHRDDHTDRRLVNESTLSATCALKAAA